MEAEKATNYAYSIVPSSGPDRSTEASQVGSQPTPAPATKAVRDAWEKVHEAAAILATCPTADQTEDSGIYASYSSIFLNAVKPLRRDNGSYAHVSAATSDKIAELVKVLIAVEAVVAATGRSYYTYNHTEWASKAAELRDHLEGEKPVGYQDSICVLM